MKKFSLGDEVISTRPAKGKHPILKSEMSTPRVETSSRIRFIDDTTPVVNLRSPLLPVRPDTGLASGLEIKYDNSDIVKDLERLEMQNSMKGEYEIPTVKQDNGLTVRRSVVDSLNRFKNFDVKVVKPALAWTYAGQKFEYRGFEHYLNMVSTFLEVSYDRNGELHLTQHLQYLFLDALYRVQILLNYCHNEDNTDYELKAEIFRDIRKIMEVVEFLNERNKGYVKLNNTPVIQFM
jgi:hypothetical protein